MDTFISILDITCDAVDQMAGDPILVDEESSVWGVGALCAAAVRSTDVVVDAPLPVDREMHFGWGGTGGFCTIC